MGVEIEIGDFLKNLEPYECQVDGNSITRIIYGNGFVKLEWTDYKVVMEGGKCILDLLE